MAEIKRGVVARVLQEMRAVGVGTYPEVEEIVIRPDLLEKSRQVACNLAGRGAKAVVLYGSTARGKREPGDLDFLVFGNVDGGNRRELRELEEELSSQHGIKVQLIIFSEEYMDSLIDGYKRARDKGKLGDLIAFLMFERMDPGRENAATPLIPLLSEEEFQNFFGKPIWGFPFQKEYLILEGRNYVNSKREQMGLF